MGRSYTPKYRVDYRDQGGWHSVCWDTKRNGRPTDANLEQWRRKMNTSFNHGGVNHHVSKACGYLVHISKAALVNQRNGEPVAMVSAPMFEVC